MGKSQQRGVRFNMKTVEKLKEEGKATGFQTVLNYLDDFYWEVIRAQQSPEVFDSEKINVGYEDEPPKTKEIYPTKEAARDACPPELTGIERSIWITEHTKKY